MSVIAGRLLPITKQPLSAYRDEGGYRALEKARSDVAGLRETLAQTSLAGLGGARFPFSTKLKLALQSPGPRVVVCNAAEDEPGSRKDQTLLQRNPHLVIEGVLIAAHALDAERVFLYVSETLTEALDSLDRALTELAAEEGLLNGIEIRVCKAPTTYVAGEASAAIQAIEGREAKPVIQPPYPTESGVDGRPTLISNCETLANLRRVVEAGAQEPQSEAAYSRLATVSGDVAHPGVYEIQPDETSFADLITLAGGVTDSQGGGRLKAIQPGGPSSAYLPASAAGVLLTDSAIRAAGSQPGCLAVRVLSEDRCLVEEVADVTAFFAREQCGQCPGCRMKTQAYNKIIHQIQSGHGKWPMLDQLSVVDDFVADMPRRCALISMPTPPVFSAVELFRDDFEAHIERSTCGVSRT
jgi:NADH-quinone oxidoreductase subunit F